MNRLRGGAASSRRHGQRGSAWRQTARKQGQKLLHFAGGTVLCVSPGVSSIFADIIQ